MGVSIRDWLCATAPTWLLARLYWKKLLGIKKPDTIADIGSVPRAGLEPALAFKYQLDFKSNASTNSATEAKK